MKRLNRALCIALATSLTTVAISQSPTSPIDQAAVELSPHQGTGPLVITSIKVDGQEVGTEKFQVAPGDEWLRKLSVTVVNKTSHVVDGADLNLSFPETGTGSHEEPMVGYQYQWGSTPSSRHNAPILGKSTPRSLGIPPNGEAEVNLGEHYGEYAKLLSSRMGSASPHRLSISVTLVDFANKVEWVPNAFYEVIPGSGHVHVNEQEMYPNVP